VTGIDLSGSVSLVIGDVVAEDDEIVGDAEVVDSGNCRADAGTGLRLRDARVGSESRAAITREADTEDIAI
jgi:hypothetical protein